TALLRLNNVARTAKVFRLRGLALRMWRGIVALEVVEMLISRNPERRLERLEARMEYKLEEIDDLRREIGRVQKRVEARAEKVAAGEAAADEAATGETELATEERDTTAEPATSTETPPGLRSA
ncbi:MAG: hypothetical protein ACR2NP_06545, partial [Pirellulaceae bacterium]